MLIIVNVCNYKTGEWRGTNWIFLSQLLLIFPNAPNITEKKIALNFHILQNSISSSLYLLNFSV